MKGIKTTNPLRANAQKLRKEMTRQERHLWYDFLKNLPQTVHCQKMIGNFRQTLYLIFDYPYKYYTFKHFEV